MPVMGKVEFSNSIELNYKKLDGFMRDLGIWYSRDPRDKRVHIISEENQKILIKHLGTSGRKKNRRKKRKISTKPRKIDKRTLAKMKLAEEQKKQE